MSKTLGVVMSLIGLDKSYTGAGPRTSRTKPVEHRSTAGTAARAGFGQGPGVFLPAKELGLCDRSGFRGFGVRGFWLCEGREAKAVTAEKRILTSRTQAFKDIFMK